ncbi:MAG TPA: hypothetical protein VK709_07285 [Candidatus Saccharimonadales bacterium]|jgi:hypothetical protein|nr:hypothetical protein [Candidatus Saccharimonadales bacterium]
MEVEEVKDAQELKDKNIPRCPRGGDFSVPLFPQFPLFPLLPLFFFAILLFSPKLHSQTNQPPAAPALSHDLSGVWMQYPDGDVPGVPGMNAVDDRTRPPLTPWGKEKFDAARPLVGPRAVPGEENNPALRCDPDGPPKLLNLPNPFEIIQIPGRVLMFFELGHIWREIWTDGRPLPKDPEPSYLGYSVGKWEGDTFIVDTIGFNDELWDDSYGNPRSDATHLTERYRRLNENTLELQIIIDDPKAYTKPWVSPPKLHKLEPGWEIAEWFCVVDEDNAYDKVVRKPAGVAPAVKK